jgi:PAS domain S-box-containing protein
MKLRDKAEGLVDFSRRVRRGHSGVKVVSTRLIVSAAMLVLIRLLTFIPNRAPIIAVVVLYAAVILLLVLLFHDVIEQRRFRLAATLIDVAAISFLVKLTGSSDSSWFLLYVFPIMSIARYLGVAWSFFVASIGTMAYGWALSPLPRGPESIATFGVRAIILTAVAFTAAKLARTHYREEQTFAEMLQVVDHPVATTVEFEAAITRILHAAIKMTRSDVSVIAIDNDGVRSIYAAGVSAETSSVRQEDLDDARRLLAAHYQRVVDTRRPFPLAKKGFGAMVGGLRSIKTKHWSGRLVPLAIGGPPFAVLGVFSRNSIHYRPDDILKLRRVASAVAILQKNAKVSRPLVEEAESLRHHNEMISQMRLADEARLKMLYDIGNLLKKEIGIAEVLTKIVRIVVERLRSEEAALFLWDEREERLFKKAVAGADDAATEQLLDIERSYESGESLTGAVFQNRRAKRLNKVPVSIAHVSEYSKLLASGHIKHYLGVPLLIGDEVLGVIRVLNRKSVNYVPKPGLAILDTDGFDAADRDLLTMTARLIAVAIRSAGFVEQKRYFENLVYQSPDPIIVLDENRKVKHFNRACSDIWHVEEREVIGHSVINFYRSPEHAREIAKLLDNARDHTIRDHEAWLRVEGNIIPIRLSATEFRTKSGKFAGSIGIFKDARQEHQDRLGALVKLSRASGHDIKNDVLTIRHSLPRLKKIALTNAEAAPSYETVRQATDDALRKLQGLLMTAHAPHARVGPIALSAEVQAFAAAMKSRLESAKVVFSLTVSDGDTYVSADREQLWQVFANLLGNSLDAIVAAGRTPGTRRIDVVIQRTETRILLLWRDNGIGMSAEAARDAFTAFYTTKDAGNGLGLYINKTIVESHGGDIAIESTIGDGTCIAIGLPLKEHGAKEASIIRARPELEGGMV